MSRLHPLLLLAPLGAVSCEIPEMKSFYCGSPSLSVRDDVPAGDVRLRAKLRQDDSEPATVAIGYSTDGGETWYEATLEGETQGLASSPDGEKNDFVWDSRSDLGKGKFEGVSLRVTAFSECGLWATDQVDEVTVDNSETLDDGCTVEVKEPDSPEDGPIVVEYTLYHPEGLDAYIAPTFSTDGGETWSQVSLLETDCDGDGASEKLSGLGTSTEGVDHCFTWDSQLDFASDESVVLEIACGVGYGEDSVVQTGAFDVENDPAPGLDEVIITELMPEYASSGDYFELYNRTDHILDLNGLQVQRYKGEIDSDSVPKEFSFDDPSGSLLLYPGEYLLVAETDDEGSNGCLEPDALWGDAYSMSDNSTIFLIYNGETITTLAFLEVTRGGSEWIFDEDVAYGLDPDKYDSNSWSSFDNWCAQSSSIETCEDYGSETGFGTPGAVNDACP